MTVAALDPTKSSVVDATRAARKAARERKRGKRRSRRSRGIIPKVSLTRDRREAAYRASRFSFEPSVEPICRERASQLAQRGRLVSPTHGRTEEGYPRIRRRRRIPPLQHGLHALDKLDVDLVGHRFRASDGYRKSRALLPAYVARPHPACRVGVASPSRREQGDALDGDIVSRQTAVVNLRQQDRLSSVTSSPGRKQDQLTSISSRKGLSPAKVVRARHRTFREG